MKKAIKLLIVMLLFALMIFGALYVMENETQELQQQESFGEEMADEYIFHITQESNTSETTETQETLPSDLDYEDNEIYSKYDESYAKGHVDCVLEIPAIDLRQSIFTGTVAQIEHDLSRWLSVTARSDYVIGDTHYCIYMHNPRDKSIQISLAQETMVVGDYMVLTKDNKVYLYAVTGVFAEWRNKCSDKYVNNKNVDNNKLYIFTCARGKWQGKNLVIEGTVYKVYNLNDWNANKDYFITQYKKDQGFIEDNAITTKVGLNLALNSKDGVLYASTTASDYTNTTCTIGVFDSEGYLLEDLGLIECGGEEVAMPLLTEGKYYIGIYQCDEQYEPTMSYCVKVDKSQQIAIGNFEDENQAEQGELMIIKTTALTLVAIVFIVGFVGVFKALKEECR